MNYEASIDMRVFTDGYLNVNKYKKIYFDTTLDFMTSLVEELFSASYICYDEQLSFLKNAKITNENIIIYYASGGSDKKGRKIVVNILDIRKCESSSYCFDIPKRSL